MEIRNVRLILVFAAVVWSSHSLAYEVRPCEVWIGSSAEKMSGTERLQSALTKAVRDLRVLSTTDLKRWHDQLRDGHLVTPELLVGGKSSLESVMWSRVLSELMGAEINPLQLASFIDLLLTEMSGEHSSRENGEIRTKEIIQKMEFVELDLGSESVTFNLFPEVGEATISANRLGLMSTPVTQWMWTHIMAENPSAHIDGPETRVVNVRGVDVPVRPNLPAENMTVADALRFVRTLNSGTIPDDELKEIIPSHRSGDRYTLTNHDLYLWLVTHWVGRPNGYIHSEVPHGFDEYEWYRDNSRGHTHPVASLNPYILQGQEIFDLLGNVLEMTIENLGDPTGQSKGDGFFALWMGGNFRTPIGDAYLVNWRNGNNQHTEPGTVQRDSVGLRLVRLRDRNGN